MLENFDKQCLRLLHYISAQLGTEPSPMICLKPVPCPFMTVCPTYIMAIPVLSFHLGSTVNFYETKSFVCVCVRTCFLFLVGFKDLQICITISLVLLVAEYEQDGAQPPCRKTLPPATQQGNCITFTSMSCVTAYIATSHLTSGVSVWVLPWAYRCFSIVFNENLNSKIAWCNCAGYMQSSLIF